MRNALRFLCTAIPLVTLVAPLAPAAAAADKKVEMEQLDRVYLRFSGTTRALRQLMKCELAKNEQAARDVFAHPYASPQQNEALRVFYGSGEVTYCLRPGIRQLTTRNLAAMGSLAEALMDIDGVDAPGGQLPSWGGGAGGGSFVWTWQRISEEQEAQHLPLASCLVNAHPAKVAELLATDETSNDERNLFNSMSAEIAGCVPAGQRLTVNPMLLRPALAVGFYTSARMASVASQETQS